MADEIPTEDQVHPPPNPEASTILPLEPTGGSVAEGSKLRYRPLRFHAAGNLGEVHIAKDEELNRELSPGHPAVPFIQRVRIHSRMSKT